MKEIKFRTQFNYTQAIGEINKQPSKTIPDQNISVRNLLINHSRGLPMNAQMNQGQFFGTDEPIPNFIDLTDPAAYKAELEHRRMVLDQQHKAEKEQAAERRKAEKDQKQLDLEDEIKKSLGTPPQKPPTIPEGDRGTQASK